MATFYLAEFDNTASLAEFEGVKLDKSYRVEKSETLYGWCYVRNNGLVRPAANRQVFTDLRAAVEWIIERANKKRERICEELAQVDETIKFFTDSLPPKE